MKYIKRKQHTIKPLSPGQILHRFRAGLLDMKNETALQKRARFVFFCTYGHIENRDYYLFTFEKSLAEWTRDETEGYIKRFKPYLSEVERKYIDETWK